MLKNEYQQLQPVQQSSFINCDYSPSYVINTENLRKIIATSDTTFVVTLRKLNKNKMVSNYLVRCPGLFDVKSLAGLTGYNFLGLGCRLKDMVFH